MDTCGYCSREILEKLLPYVDLVLLDLKVFDSDKHEKYIGVPNETILKNAVWISNYVNGQGKIFWNRTPIIPNYTATDDNVRKIGEFISNNLDNIPEQRDLLSFNRLCESTYSRLGITWVLKDTPLMTKEEMERFLEIAKNTAAKNVRWSGLTKKVS